MKKYLSIALLLSGCKDTTSNDYILDVSISGYGDTNEQLMMDACGIIGIECRIIYNSTISFVFDNKCIDNVCGITIKEECSSWTIVSNENVMFVAHELGHVLGLNHLYNEDNLMNEVPSVLSLREDQKKFIKLNNLYMIGECK